MEKTTIEVLIALGVLAGAYIKFKGAFTIAIQEAMQPVIASVDKLTMVVDMMREDMARNREIIHDIELKVKELQTNVDNQHRRLKILEGYHKDRSAE